MVGRISSKRIEMERWQQDRVLRSKEQPISCDRVDTTDDGCFIFSVVGSTGESYIVEIYEDVNLWPPSCTCEDNTYRPFLCKHQCYCLRLMGLDEFALEDVFYEPDQVEMYELLSNAPDVVGDR